MITRRQLLGRAMLVSAGGVAMTSVPPPVASAPRALPRASQLLIEPRHARYARLARRYTATDAEPLWLERDLLELWYERLHPSAEASPQVFAGVTTPRGFFLLQTLAADHRLRLIACTTHDVGSGRERLHAWLIGPRGPGRVS